MKIIIYAIITVAADRREDLLNLLQPSLPAVQAQTGCIRYDWAADSLNDTQINVYEEWESETALAEHFLGENFAAIGQSMRSFGILGASAKKFRIDAEASVFNESGVASVAF